MQIRSKLPDVGTTIFTVISRRAEELGAVNLGQGFPDYPVDPLLVDCIDDAMRAGWNQYAPMAGVPVLRNWIAMDLAARYHTPIDPEREVTVTLGATEAIFSAVLALVGPGEEAIVFDPSYDSYDPAIRLAGARCIRIPLIPPLFAFDWDRVRAAITPRTRLILINSPTNPSCRVMSSEELRQLAALLEGTDIHVISDEVYEQLVYDGARHCSVLGDPALRARSVAVFSFGKSLHATGLRVGYAVAPPELTTELRRVHQFNTFTIATAFQHGIAEYLVRKPGVLGTLAPFFARKRALLEEGLSGSAFHVLPAQGTYFTLVDYSRVSRLADLDDAAAASRLLEEGGVASIPLAPFYQVPPRHSLLRLCFAKDDATLARAVERLRTYA